ncbi:hypothetical protein EMCRGX_G026721 [Ephydatia muelleri]
MPTLTGHHAVSVGTDHAPPQASRRPSSSGLLWHVFGYASPEGLVQSSDLQRFADSWIAVKEFYGLLEELLGDYSIPFNVEALQNAWFRFSRVAETSNAASEGTEKAGCRQNRKIVSYSLYTMYRLWFHDVYDSQKDKQASTIEVPPTQPTESLHDTFGVPIPIPPAESILIPPAVPIPIPPAVPILTPPAMLIPIPLAVPIPIPPAVPTLIPPAVPILIPPAVPILIPPAVPIHYHQLCPYQYHQLYPYQYHQLCPY